MRTIAALALLVWGSISQAQSINWKSFQEANELSKKNPEKPILLYIYADWCGFCKKMNTETFVDSETVDYINSTYIPVKFNGESDEKINFLGYNYSYIPKGRVNSLAFFFLNGRVSYPGIVVVNKEGQTQNFLMGYMKPTDFINRLKNPV